MMSFPGVFKVFDSHSRDVYHRRPALGYSVLMSIQGIDHLGEYFRLLSMSNEPNAMIPYELKGVKCINNDDMVGSVEVCEQHDVNCEILCNQSFEQTSSKGLSTEQS